MCESRMLRIVIMVTILLTQAISMGNATPQQAGMNLDTITAAPPDNSLSSFIPHPSLPLFISNLGQWPDAVRFQMRHGNEIWWFTDEGVWVTVLQGTEGTQGTQGTQGTCSTGMFRNRPVSLSPCPLVSLYSKGVNLHLTFSGMSPSAHLVPGAPQPTHVNYFRGNDATKWRSNVSTFHSLRWEEVYPGIVLEFNQAGIQVISNLQSLISDLRLSIDGANALHADNTGHLVADTVIGPIPLPALQTADGQPLLPEVDHNSVSLRAPGSPSFSRSAFSTPRLSSLSSLSSSVPQFLNSLSSQSPISSTRRPDPLRDPRRGKGVNLQSPPTDPSDLLYSTYLGGSGDDSILAIALGVDGSVYAAGYTTSTDFPTTPGAFETMFQGTVDVIVSKLDSTAHNLVYSTLIGGQGDERAYAITVDAQGVATIVGDTLSANYPATLGAFDTTCGTDGQCNANPWEWSDAFVTRLAADGANLIYSAFLGGHKHEYSFGVAVDSSGAVYITGWTQSDDFPTTPGAFDTTYHGWYYYPTDAFVSKVSPDGSTLVYSTYLGGGSQESGSNVVVDASGAAYVAGWTFSNDFPTTPGAFSPSLSGADDAFVTKLNPSGSDLEYSTYLGGSDWDSASELAVDAVGSAYITGGTSSADFPASVQGFGPIYSGNGDAYITKLDPTGSSVVYSEFVGGSSADGASHIALDSAGSAYITGSTTSTDFPTTPGSFVTAYQAATDEFVTKIDDTGQVMIYSTYLGGSGDECLGGCAIAVAADNTVYVAAYTTSADFPVTADAFQIALNGPSDSFLAHIDPDPSGCQDSPRAESDSSFAANASHGSEPSRFPSSPTSHRFPSVVQNNDPALVYSTFLGGSAGEFIHDAAVDSSGLIYLVGETQSTDFPTTPDAFDTQANGGKDTFVAKLDPSSGTLIYSTLLGGSGDDIGVSLALASDGTVVVVGSTTSADFPTTPGAFQPTCPTCALYNGDAFVIKLDPSGSTLVFSTYLGGSGSDNANGVAVSTSGQAYVTGATSSSNFPTTPGAFDTTYNGPYNADAFVTEFRADGSTLVYSTFVGGGFVDWANAIAVDAAGAVYLAGQTNSSDFPATPGAFDTTYASTSCYFACWDGFVAKLDPTGSALAYASYLGGDLSECGEGCFGAHDAGTGIAVDGTGAAYVTGWTNAFDFPTTPGAYQPGCVKCDWNVYDAFVTKFDPSGSTLAYSSYLSGSGYGESDFGYAITLNFANEATITGNTNSIYFPITPSAYDATQNGGDDTFVSRLSADGSSLLYSTYLGGAGNDHGSAVAVNAEDQVIVAGDTASSDFPLTAGAITTTLQGGQDLFVSELNLNLLHIASINPFYQVGDSDYTVGTTVTIQDGIGQPVSDVAVWVRISLPDCSVRTLSAVSDSGGIATTSLTSTDPGLYQFTVIGVSRSGWSYLKAMNAEISDSIDVSPLLPTPTPALLTPTSAPPTHTPSPSPFPTMTRTPIGTPVVTPGITLEHWIFLPMVSKSGGEHE